MSTWPALLSTRKRPGWSMPCSISSRTSSAPASSPADREGQLMPSDHDGSAHEISGEERLIGRYFRPLATAPGAFGLGDDAAVLTPPADCDVVLTADGVIAGVHFLPNDPPGSIARKVLRMNLSDLAAKGASPVGFLLSIALPVGTEEAWIAAFTAGLAEDIKHYGAHSWAAIPITRRDRFRFRSPLSARCRMARCCDARPLDLVTSSR